MQTSMMKRLFLVFQLILSSYFGLSVQDLAAQESQPMKDQNINLQPWLDYNPSHSINTRTRLYGSFGARTIFPASWHRFYAREAIRYDITTFNNRTQRYRTWQLHGGVASFFTYNTEESNILEIRTFQGVRVRFPNWNRFQLAHYVRLEERMEIGLQKSGVEFGIRARYKTGTDLQLPGYLVTGLYIPLYAEVFFNIEKGVQFNDVFRLTPGLGYQANLSWKFQFDLSYHVTRQTETSSSALHTNDIVFRLRVYHIIQGS